LHKARKIASSRIEDGQKIWQEFEWAYLQPQLIEEWKREEQKASDCIERLTEVSRKQNGKGSERQSRI
jgi:hypothetical protein